MPNLSFFSKNDLLDLEEEKTILSLLFSDDEAEQTDDEDKRKKEIVLCDCLAGHKQLIKDYFGHHPTYNSKFFERRFRMSNNIFARILEDLQKHKSF